LRGLESQRALMTGKIKLKGNLTKALRLAAVADRLNKVLSQIQLSIKRRQDMPRILDPKDKYYIDNPGRVKAIQAEMHKRKN